LGAVQPQSPYNKQYTQPKALAVAAYMVHDDDHLHITHSSLSINTSMMAFNAIQLMPWCDWVI
jgi:hypothetical protein